MSDNIFNRNGTLQGLMNFANDYQASNQQAKSSNGTTRIGGLVGLVKSIMSLFV